jgi:hypothetical protein
VKSKSNTKKLKQLKSQYADELEGSRRRKYDILGRAMPIVNEYRLNPGAVKAFLKLPGAVRLQKNSRKSQSWITASVFAYITGAKSEDALKIVWKRARVLEHLHDYHGVSPGDIAEEIRRRGGIEAVARLAAKEDPRRRKSEEDTGHGGQTKTRPAAMPSGKAELAKRPPRALSAASADENMTGEDSNDEAEDKLDSPALEKGTMLVGISGDLRDELKEVTEGERVKLIGTRTGDWGESFLFEVEKVVALVRKRRLRWGKPAKAKRKP